MSDVSRVALVCILPCHNFYFHYFFIFETNNVIKQYQKNYYTGSDVISIKCRDMDEGKNGHISMHFQRTAASDKFEIRPDGRIKIKSILDYESQENFNPFLKLTVFVRDNPPDPKDSLTSTVTVNVKVCTRLFLLLFLHYTSPPPLPRSLISLLACSLNCFLIQACYPFYYAWRHIRTR